MSKSAILKHPHYKLLKKHYETKPIVLFTGAGVAKTSTGEFGVGGWSELLARIAHARLGSAAATKILEETERLEPWDQAEELAARIGREVFAAEIVSQVRRRGNFEKHYRLLSRDFLKAAPTLAPVAAFCAHLTGYAVGKNDLYHRVEPNPRVAAIVSTNYDCYLEAAAASKFKTVGKGYLLKPVAARGSTVGTVGQVPVYHVHGYVSASVKPKRRIQSFVEPVLTARDYDEAWCDSARSPTLGPLVHLLRHFSVLFLGFSFQDPWVSSLMADLEQDRRARKDRCYHYALLSAARLARRGRSWFLQRGVKPIAYEAPDEIATVLRDLYCAGVRASAAKHGGLRLIRYRALTSSPDGLVGTLGSGGAEYCWRSLLGAHRGKMPPLPADVRSV